MTKVFYEHFKDLYSLSLTVKQKISVCEKPFLMFVQYMEVRPMRYLFGAP